MLFPEFGSFGKVWFWVFIWDGQSLRKTNLVYIVI